MEVYPFNMLRKLLVIGTAIMVITSVGCQRKTFSRPENIPPQTFIAIPASRTDTVPARIGLAWYANDPDGEVVQYRYVWLWGDSVVIGTTYTTSTTDTFVLPVFGDVRTYTFRVWAQDNEGAWDPTPAQVSFPMVNSPPEIAFAFRSLPSETTLPAVTFFVEAHDVDGDSTLTDLLYKLDLDTVWTAIPYAPSITLTGIPPGNRTVYFRVSDFTGALSDSVSFQWTVEPMAGSLLVILDHVDDPTPWIDLIERAGYSPGSFTIWEFPKHESRSVQDFPEIRESFQAIALAPQFSSILWGSDHYDPSITSLDLFTFPDLSGRAIFEDFLSRGGKILLSGEGAFQEMAASFAQTYLGVDPYDTTQSFQNRSILASKGPMIRVAPSSLPIPDTLYFRPGVAILVQPDGFLGGGFTPLYQAVFLVNAQDSVAFSAIMKNNVALFSFALPKLDGGVNAHQVVQALLGP